MKQLPFQLTAFLGAYLMFLVEPVIAKQLLPWFGGAPSVWTTCMIFFQVALVAGYAYPHIVGRVGSRVQALLHIGLLVIVATTLPITAAAAWKPAVDGSPILRLLEILAATVGAPYVVLAATTPLLQGWYRLSARGRSPYSLYVLSNAGSLLALLSYPVVIERWMTGRAIALAWSVGFLVFTGAWIWCGWGMLRAPLETGGAQGDPASPERDRPTTPGARVLWIALPACGAALLLAVTNQLCQDIAVVPLLWVVPLALYLLTYVLSFANWYSRVPWMALFVASAGATAFVLGHAGSIPTAAQATIVVSALLSGCMVCHGELACLAPPAQRATGYYLAIAVGGCLGGILVGVLAPAVFTTYLEFPLLLIAVFGVGVVVVVRDVMARRHVRGLAIVWTVPIVATLAAFALSVHAQADGVVARTRNFYGVLTVIDTPGQRGVTVQLMNGRVLHGAELLSGPDRAQPTTYYAPGSGIAVAIGQHPRRIAGQPLRVGVIGLGAGTIAAWGRSGDTFRFFEINPADVDIARRYFTFLKESAASTDVVLGDGRLSLEREVADVNRLRRYDVLAVDAFSGDSIPVHLLTREAFDVYLRAMAPDGVLAVHVSNRMIDLEPVVRALADERGLDALEIVRGDDPGVGAVTSVWILVTQNAAFRARASPLATRMETTRSLVWTDDYSSVLSVLR